MILESNPVNVLCERNNNETCLVCVLQEIYLHDSAGKEVFSEHITQLVSV